MKKITRADRSADGQTSRKHQTRSRHVDRLEVVHIALPVPAVRAPASDKSIVTARPQLPSPHKKLVTELTACTPFVELLYTT